MKLATLCLLVRNERVFLARKKKKIGAGLWNGYGGMVESGESIAEAAVREAKEEARVEIALTALDKRGFVNFHFDGVPKLQVHIFFVGSGSVSRKKLPKWALRRSFFSRKFRTGKCF
ncbi:MAG: NUDIX domain-containing protein [bacterium]|nr:NUDIX domain-containing protein [bacterium]